MRALVIGVGRMGRRHVQVLLNLGMQVAGLCDQSADALAAARKEFNLGEVRTSANAVELLKEVAPEAVVIATTAPSHCELVLAAVEAGARYILCEKPMATSLEEADRMIAACEQRGVALAVNHQMQFMPQYVDVRSAASTPELGGLASILVAGSNFGLAMNASHYFEMFRYVTGETVASVAAWFDPDRVPNPRGPQFEDRAGALRAVGTSGLPMVIDFSARAGHGLLVVYTCRFGQIVVDELTGFMRVVRREDQYRELPTTRYGMPAVEDIRAIPPADTIAPTQAVWEAMLAGRPYPDGKAGRHAVQCLFAAHASNERGGAAVRLDDAGIDRARRFPWA